MADPHVIALRKPVGPKGKEITELVLREPTIGEYLRSSSETGVAQVLIVLKLLSGAAPEAIDALPERAVRKADSYISGCFIAFMKDMDDHLVEFRKLDEMPDEFVIDLPETIQIGTTWVSKLDMRELTGIEMVKADQVEGVKSLISKVAFSSGQSRIIIELMPLSVFARAAAYVLGFMPAALTVGGES